MVLYGYYMSGLSEDAPEIAPGGSACIVAVDGGGTGCRVRLADSRGRILAEASGGPANVNTDFGAARRNIRAAIDRVYEDAGRSRRQAAGDVAWLGLAGAGFGDLARRMEAGLGFAAVRVTTDSMTTVEGALGGAAQGTVVLIGTGSFFVRREGGRDRHVGGWGYQLGDECSGAWLGRELLRAVLHVHDGLLASSPLTEAVSNRFGGDPGAIVRHAQAVEPGEIARLAPEIVAAHDAGDPVAGAIMARGVGILCERLEHLGARNGGTLCMLGGLGGVYERLLPAGYRGLCRPPRGNALDGAIALARRYLLALAEAGAGCGTGRGMKGNTGEAAG